MPKRKIVLEPRHNLACFDAFLDARAIGEVFFCGEFSLIYPPDGRATVIWKDARICCTSASWLASASALYP